MAVNFEIAPSLLAADLTSLKEEVLALDKAKVDVIHLDVMDGHFVPNLTFGMPIIKALRPLTKIPFDAHLMMTNPDKYIEEFKDAGCDWISVHVETCPNLKKTLAHIRSLGMKAGIAINPGTPLNQLNEYLDDLDYVLIMSVYPGFAGQSFTPGSFERVTELRKRIGARNVKIQIDGGIKKDNLAEAISAGCDVVVMGTGFFSLKDYSKAMKTLKETVNAARR